MSKDPLISVLPFRTPYDGLHRKVSDATAISFVNEVPRTQQQYRDECDINNIMEKYKLTGVLRVRNNYARGEYIDLASAPDFRESLDIVAKAQDAFDALPSSLRKRFGNDPMEFLDFVHDPKNIDEIDKMGLTKPKSPPKEVVPIAVRVVAPEEPDTAEHLLRSFAERAERFKVGATHGATKPGVKPGS